MGYSKLIRSGLVSNEKTQRKLRCILLSERSKSENATYCMIPSNHMTFWKGKLIDAIKISDSLWLGGRK
jgi:hypothetical protein